MKTTLIVALMPFLLTLWILLAATLVVGNP